MIAKLKEMSSFFEKRKNEVFLILMVMLYFILDYQTILFLRPQGIHFIRQTDSLSFVANYFKNGMSFFSPQVFNLNSIDGKATCEFPILYYITALLYKVFGEHEFMLRLITLTIASAGFFALFKLLNELLDDTVYALLFTFLFISSTVLLYYSNNFLPDASAFGFVLIGWFYFFSFLKNQRNKKQFILSFLFFTLSSLLKVTYFLNPISALLAMIIFDWSNKIKAKQIIKNHTIPIITFFISLLLIAGWNLYAIHYNQVNKDHYFLVHSRPMWQMSKSQILEVWDLMSNYWYSRYYFQSTFHFFAVLFIAGLFFLKKAKKMTLLVTLFVTLGSISYGLLFFAQFKNHDYYFIALIPAIIFVITHSFIVIKNKFPRLINNFIAKLLLLMLCTLSINYARMKLKDRYTNKDEAFAQIGVTLSKTRSYIDSLGIPENSKFIIYTDQTPNGGLYFINHQGWNIRDTSEVNLKRLNEYLKQGAQYLICTEKNDNYFDADYKKVGKANGITIYKTDIDK